MNKLKSSRLWSFVTVALIYGLCILVGVGQYGYLPYSTPVNLLIADTVATVACFIYARIPSKTLVP